MSTSTSVILDVTTATFSSEVLNSDRPTLVDFWAPWCGICKTIRPMVDAFAAREQARVKVVALNAQDYPDIANQYGVMALPTFLVFKDGQVVGHYVGRLNERELAALTGIS